MNKDNNIYKQLLRGTGLKATPARIAVLQFFESNQRPLNIDDIAKSVERVDMVTIYRIMEAFVKKGIARPVHICGKRLFFELIALPHHHHIVCKKCGMIEDVHDCHLSDVITKIVQNSKAFDNITEHTFELFGICEKCK